MEKFSEIKYVRPDFKKLGNEMKKYVNEIKNAKDYASLREAYMNFEKTMTDSLTMATVSHIRNTLDQSDKFYEDEQKYISKASAKLSLVSLKFIDAVLKSPFKDDIAKEFGDLIIKSAEMEKKLISKKIIIDLIKESSLTRQYSKTAALCVTDFRGEKCNFYGLLKHMESTDREERKEAFEAWANLYESVSKQLDFLYDNLVKTRVKKAKKLGFDSFIDYVYLDRERFDYTAKDVERFRNEVRDVIVPVCRKICEKQAKRLNIDKLRYYDESLVFPEGNALPIGNKDELVEKARVMYNDMSKETGEYFNFMVENELFDLETRPNKHLGGYCTFLAGYKAPFIFSNFNGTSADVDVLTHEAGHAFQAYLASRTLPLMSMTHSTSEINEIHSMSMEHFAYPYMDSFFGEKADKYRYSHLCSALMTIPYLVSVDEFQHRVFENPSMTAEERRKAWKKIEETYLPDRDYDGNEFLEGGGFWMQKQHIFLYPFYYIEYALAQICAFQFFIRSREDKEESWEDYVRLCKAGGSLGYFDLLKLANLENPFKEGTVKNTVDKIVEIIDEFEQKI